MATPVDGAVAAGTVKGVASPGDVIAGVLGAIAAGVVKGVDSSGDVIAGVAGAGVTFLVAGPPTGYIEPPGLIPPR